ncbi:MAG TPA: type II toxin-antitoxin system RelE/ParE family toxin [Candidatus Paceibacterota bacterium]|jgi:mRNA-degrading endonuclease RelE of RelBE toxin-antitoxin system|nr:type II toxin-antitoxin system RelE/ParE family toxin [Candidatus Paceibacterota bacterium]
MPNSSAYVLVIPIEFESILKKLKQKKPDIFKSLEKKIIKIVQNPVLGKPLRNTLRNYRRVHIDPFVLIYEIYMFEVRLIDFDHHDKIYKKYKFS